MIDSVGKAPFVLLEFRYLRGLKLSEMSWCCLPCFGSSAKDADSKDSVKKEVSAKDGSVTQQSHRASLGEQFLSLQLFGIC